MIYCVNIELSVRECHKLFVMCLSLQIQVKSQYFNQGRMAEWSKALVLGTSHFGGVGSNPTPVMFFFFFFFLGMHIIL